MYVKHTRRLKHLATNMIEKVVFQFFPNVKLQDAGLLMVQTFGNHHLRCL